MKKYSAELIGTFILVFCGTGAMVIDQQTGGQVSHVGVAITWGLVVMSLIYSIGDLSGCHINPAVSIAFSLSGRLKPQLLPGYIASQLLGALLASLLLRLLFPTCSLLGATLPKGSEIQSFTLELLLTFFLMLVILRVAHGSKENGQFAGIAIGAVVGLEALFAGPICGASMNPARSIAPAIVSGNLNHLWLYIMAPIAGAALAIPVCKYLAPKTEQ
ncbi:aquaporin [Mucilaginibacter sp. X4EP1]|uniref:aquaporin n=1 Tax=Mucilaginibacter sp. X4EP1 TaxID=2723092 RepID=UPI002167E13D|nr:aquaporin [Mucilaginibacter sp. X4EP1]MCS3816126.1 aquaporin Z [Mucilaginibacter sp. X4EP1]